MKKRIVKDDSVKKEIIVRNIFIGLLVINLIVNFLSFFYVHFQAIKAHKELLKDGILACFELYILIHHNVQCLHHYI